MEKDQRVKVIEVDSVDEARMIQVGDLGEVKLIESNLIYVLLKTGLATGSIYTINLEQLRAI